MQRGRVALVLFAIFLLGSVIVTLHNPGSGAFIESTILGVISLVIIGTEEIE